MERLHRDLGEEGEGTLGAYHRVGDDVERIVIGYQRTQVQTRYVLDAVFGFDTLCQFLVCANLVAQIFNLFQKLGVTLAEGRFALFRTSVEHGTIGQDDAGRDHHTVAVGMHAAVHTRGIVDHDTTHHG